MEQILFRAMGCEIFCGVDAAHSHIREHLARVPAMFEAWEKILSRFRADSELSQLNARAGQTVRVSETLWRVLKLAQRAQEFSNGLVTPTILDALRAAGYNRSFEETQNAPQPFISAQPAPAPTHAPAWELHDLAHSISLTPNTQLDLNGVAKGWAIEQTASYLGELGPALVDAGGDMVITAPRANGEPWHIGIEDAFNPAQENDALPILKISRGATATSARTWRKWLRDGKPMHHLIDPRTGLPAATDVMSVTVLAPDIFHAEVAAKVFLIRGSQAGMSWIEQYSFLSALAILENGAVVTSSRLQEYIA